MTSRAGIKKSMPEKAAFLSFIITSLLVLRTQAELRAYMIFQVKYAVMVHPMAITA